jgi:hypothetical protein
LVLGLVLELLEQLGWWPQALQLVRRQEQVLQPQGQALESRPQQAQGQQVR